MALYPLLMSPCYRYGYETPWGGSMLRDAFMKDAPDRCGESLEVSTLPTQESCVCNGPYAGVTLSHMVGLWGEDLTGTLYGFPLLIKLMDTAEPVECEDAPAAAWVVLNCETDAQLTAGDTVNVRPGEVLAIPAGLSRSIDADVQLYVVQATDSTHINSGKMLKVRGITSLCRGGSRTYYISSGELELCRLNISGEMPLSDGRMLLLTPLSSCTLRWGEGELELMPFENVVVPAALEDVSVYSDDSKLLMASLPRQEALRKELGYRAEGVAGLV